MIGVLCVLAGSMLFAGLDSGPPSGLAVSAASDPYWVNSQPALSPLIFASEVITTTRVYLPFITRVPDPCGPIPSQTYSTLTVEGAPTDRPAEQHADLNLALRSYEVTSAYKGLVTYGGPSDPGAPQLYTLFADKRVPEVSTAYRVYDWDWSCNCRGALLDQWDVTLAGFGTTPGEVIHVPDSNYNIGQGYEVLVLYASPNRVTLKYTRNDNVVDGYTVHVENVCVEPALLALYQHWNAAGRGRLPALRGGQPFGRALGYEIGVAIRDAGTFMDPRSRGDWWDEPR